MRGPLQALAVADADAKAKAAADAAAKATAEAEAAAAAKPADPKSTKSDALKENLLKAVPIAAGRKVVFAVAAFEVNGCPAARLARLASRRSRCQRARPRVWFGVAGFWVLLF